MFKSEFAEGRGDGSLMEFRLPEWSGVDAAWGLLRYLYTGDPDGGVASRFLPPDEDKCEIVCQLLRLAHLYQLGHLLEWCETYLGSASVLGVYNILSLLVYADMCEAKQLKRVCIYNARNMLAVVVKMEGWAMLPDHLRELVCKDYRSSARES
mmetsp:Transcript_28061/g.83861  ORF Transcript_28061/g.83861 Transcript_28061/m.83861 type:complete len:153 (-) Transcript_28061:885-1343(-)